MLSCSLFATLFTIQFKIHNLINLLKGITCLFIGAWKDCWLDSFIFFDHCECRWNSRRFKKDVIGKILVQFMLITSFFGNYMLNLNIDIQIIAKSTTSLSVEALFVQLFWSAHNYICTFNIFLSINIGFFCIENCVSLYCITITAK